MSVASDGPWQTIPRSLRPPGCARRREPAHSGAESVREAIDVDLPAPVQMAPPYGVWNDKRVVVSGLFQDRFGGEGNRAADPPRSDVGREDHAERQNSNH